MTDERDWVLHVDLDQFQAAVEIRRRPELAGRPVVVGGDGDPTRPRQVVATASYEARAFGVQSGMPLRTALRRCPDAVFLAQDMVAYEAASNDVMDVLRDLPIVVEVLGWDEAFVAPREPTEEPAALAGTIRQAVLERTGLSCAVGIGTNKLQAKLATGFAKPGGIFRITDDDWEELFADRPVTALWGIGPRIGARLDELGVRTVRELGDTPPAVLAKGFLRREAVWLHLLGKGKLAGAVDPTPRERKGRSRETTYTENLRSRAQIEDQLTQLATALAGDAVRDGVLVTTIGVKIRFAPYITVSRQSVVRPPSTDAAALTSVAIGLLERFDLIQQERPVRLLGVRAEYLRPTSDPP